VRFTLQYPIAHPGYDPALVEPDGLRRVSQAAEAAGFDCLAFTEHPIPSQKWMAAGGHDSFDPITALAWCAAVTTTIRLQPYLLVLPYRNPFLAAKQAATLDVMSGGRLTLGLATGYLRSEFAALGVDFEERNTLFDEALDVMLRIWSEDSVAYEGVHFTALGQTARPRPRQHPHPPLWIGGNSRVARQRVAARGQGWAPLLIDQARAATTRTPPLASPADLRRAVDDLHSMAAAAGRSGEAIDVQVEWAETSTVTAPAERCLERIDALAAAGAGWVVVDPPGDDVGRTVDLLAAYGEAVIARARG
jgi:probable F420-dependent oxidoreductase